MAFSTTRLFVALLALVITGVSAAQSNANLERLAVCRPNTKISVNITIGMDAGQTLHWYTAKVCPEAKPPSRVEARDDWKTPLENGVIHAQRQTCTQCPCSNGSIQCFCSNTPGAGEFADSLLIFSCSDPTPPEPNAPIPVTADCTTLASLMVNGAPAGSPLNFPVQTNGYYNIPARTILIWEFQGCGFAYFNDMQGSYNICAKDLANSANALAVYCPGVNNIEGEFQNDQFNSLLVYNPAALH